VACVVAISWQHCREEWAVCEEMNNGFELAKCVV
jgi:hypothetical protein